MTELVDKLKSYDSDYWDFSQYRDTDNLIKYPATMVAPMQEQILRNVLQYDNKINNILDPFVGSGTSLCIGNKLGLDVLGIDINPLAILITRVKLEGVPPSTIGDSISILKTHITLLLNNTKQFEFNNIHKWFRNDIINDLSIIRNAIQLEKNAQIRRFFWVCFADTVKKYSNTRSSTFKLHIKEAENIKNMKNDCLEYFTNRVSTIYGKYVHSKNKNIYLYVDDSIKKLSYFKENSVDLICTSPPYGDNHTTVTYGQYSILPLLWIDLNDLDPFDSSLLNNFSAIDSASLGGRYKVTYYDQEYKDLLNGISKEKSKKVISFYDDYCRIFQQMVRILKPDKRMVLTLGNRRVDNLEMPFNFLNDRLAIKYGLKKEATITRNIQGKRMPLKVSHIPDLGSVKSMSKEYIVIYTKL